MRNPIRSPTLAFVLLCCFAGSWGCGAPPGDPAPGSDDGISFELLGALPVEIQGESSPFSWTAPEGAGAFVLRVRAPANQHQDRLCHTLVDVVVDGEIWVGPGQTALDWGSTCQDCSHRVQLGHGYGLFSFPNNGDALPPGPREVTGRVALRDCETRLPVNAAIDGELPDTLNLEVASAETPAEGAVGDIHVALVIASTVAPVAADLENDGVWSQGFALASEVLAQAGLVVTLSRVVEIGPPSESLVEFGPGAREALDGLSQTARAGLDGGEIPVIAVPCLERYDPIYSDRDSLQAHVPRIPGGAPLGGTADGVFIAVEDCGLGDPKALWTDPTSLGHLLAHELGHYLGLYHAREESGLNDHIEDSDATGNLMHWDRESQGGVELSEGQIRVLRSHPLIRW